ncbi:MAG: hypothetical protein ACRD1G_10030, partial [Acidimicrobiales bacterium]
MSKLSTLLRLPTWRAQLRRLKRLLRVADPSQIERRPQQMMILQNDVSDGFFDRFDRFFSTSPVSTGIRDRGDGAHSCKEAERLGYSRKDTSA